MDPSETRVTFVQNVTMRRSFGSDTNVTCNLPSTRGRYAPPSDVLGVTWLRNGYVSPEKQELGSPADFLVRLKRRVARFDAHWRAEEYREPLVEASN